MPKSESSPARVAAALESQEFYELMQAYRHCPIEKQADTVAAFEAVKSFIQEELDKVARSAPQWPTASELCNWCGWEENTNAMNVAGTALRALQKFMGAGSGASPRCPPGSMEPSRTVFSHGTALDFEGEITYLQELGGEAESPSSPNTPTDWDWWFAKTAHEQLELIRGLRKAVTNE